MDLMDCKRRCLVATALFSLIFAGCSNLLNVLNFDRKGNVNPQVADSLKKKSSFISEKGNDKNSTDKTADEYEMMGDSYFKQGHPELALLQYEKAVRAGQENPRIRYKLGRILLSRGHYLEARREFQAILQRYDDNAMANLGMGWTYFMTRDFTEAEKYLNIALLRDSGLSEAHHLLALIYDFRQQFDAAWEHYRKAIAITPREVSLYNNLGVSMLLKGEYEKAVECFLDALKVGGPNRKIQNNLALTLCKLGRHNEAFELFRKTGGEAFAFNNVGVAYLMEEKYEKAVAAFEKALEISPEFYTKAYENLSRARISIGSAVPE